jgi:ParB family chromosome partitioning protein
MTEQAQHIDIQIYKKLLLSFNNYIFAKNYKLEEDKSAVVKERVSIIKLTQLVDSPFQSRFKDVTGRGEEKATQQDIAELSRSIEQSGLMQPIIVRKAAKGYEIIDGHRRVQAMRHLGRGQISAIVRECTEHEAQVMHVIGNLQRKNLKTIELAITYHRLLETGVFKDKRELSKAIAKDETYVGDLLGTLQLDKRIIDDLARNNLLKDLRMFRIIRLHHTVDQEGNSDEQWELYRKVIFTKMTRKQLAAHVKKSGNQSLMESYRMKTSGRKITIQIETGILNKISKEKLIKLLNDKISEIKDELS